MKQSKLNDVFPPELEDVGEIIDFQFKTLTTCLFSWIDSPYYQDLIRHEKRLNKRGLPFYKGRRWLINQTKKSLIQMGKRLSNDIPYLKFQFQFNGYINWLEKKEKTNSLIIHTQNDQRYSPQEIMEILKEGN